MTPTISQIELSQALAKTAQDIIRSAMEYGFEAGAYLTAREQRALNQHLDDADILLSEAFELADDHEYDVSTPDGE